MPKLDDYNSADFPATQWSLVARVGHVDGAMKRQALVQLLTRYMPALRSHLVGRMRIDPNQADDLLQGFLLSKILEDGIIERAEKERGKFRSLLLVALDRFCMNEDRRQRTQKRGGQLIVPLTEDHEGALATASSDGMFDIAWAKRVITEVLRAMRKECQDSNRPDVWGVFEARVLNPMLECATPVDYQVLADRFGLKLKQAQNIQITGTRMFIRVLRRTVGEYASGEEEIDAEIRDLHEILARPMP